MSTKAIRAALEDLEAACTHPNTTEAHRETLRRARAEVEAIEKACRYMATVDTSKTPNLARLKEAAAHYDLIEQIAKETT